LKINQPVNAYLSVQLPKHILYRHRNSSVFG